MEAINVPQIPIVYKVRTCNTTPLVLQET